MSLCELLLEEPMLNRCQLCLSINNALINIAGYRLEPRRKLLDRRILEQILHLQLKSVGAKSCRDLNRLNRVAAKRKEMISSSNIRRTQHSLPNFG
ncbi:hypothetical protein D3C78_1425880 [compost metagenome]